MITKKILLFFRGNSLEVSLDNLKGTFDFIEVNIKGIRVIDAITLGFPGFKKLEQKPVCWFCGCHSFILSKTLNFFLATIFWFTVTKSKNLL